MEPEVTFAEDGVVASDDQSFEVALAAAEVNDVPPADAPKSMKHRAIHGSVWTFAGYGGSQAIRFGANLILTRLLFPRAFGLMTLIAVLMQGLQMFSDLGIGPAIIKHTRTDDPKFFNTAWTMQVIRGFILWLVACALAVPVASFYDAPMLATMIPIAALTALISGFTSTKLYIEGRDLRLARVVGIEITSHVVSVVVMILLAWYWSDTAHAVYALVYGTVLGILLKVALSHIALPGMSNRICLDRDAMHHLYHFGRWIFVSTLFSFLALQIDRLLLARLVTLDMLGIYSVALALVSIVMGIFEQFTNRVLMPAMAHVKRSSHDQFAEVVRKSRKYILSVAMLAVGNMILLAPAFFYILYDTRYHAAGLISQWLGFGLWFTLLQRTSQASLLALGHSKSLAIANAANFVITIISAPIGYHLLGMKGFILGWTVGNLVAVIIVDMALSKDGISLFRQDTVLTVGLFLFVAIGFFIRQALQVQYVFTTHALFIKVLVSGVLSIAAAGLMYLEYRRSRVTDAGALDVESNGMANATLKKAVGVLSNGAASEVNGAPKIDAVRRD